ncbi:MAG: FtsB family cell division protein [Solidesulfovibrio sp. DCME]|uniref:FtsB family cell division protein n=1 Tax=Solidesulfovibrio sp. DCME TaxID=3447380 RepID=UPI003D0C1D9C
MIWRRFLLTGLIFFNIFLLYNLIWSDNGIFAYLELKSRHEQLKQRLATVDDHTLDLSQEIRWLKTDRAFTEKMARSQMNYLKENEILYQFPKDAAASRTPEGDRADGQ